MTRRTSGDEQIVGIGIWRDFARISQRDTWPVYRGSRSTIISQLGTLTGLRGGGSGHRVELIPYTVTRNVTQRHRLGHPQQLTGGADLRVWLGSALTVNATVSADFGQVEADPTQLDLSAFGIRVDERRPFFLAGNALFGAAGRARGCSTRDASAAPRNPALRPAIRRSPPSSARQN